MAGFVFAGFYRGSIFPTVIPSEAEKPHLISYSGLPIALRQATVKMCGEAVAKRVRIHP